MPRSAPALLLMVVVAGCSGQVEISPPAAPSGSEARLSQDPRVRFAKGYYLIRNGDHQDARLRLESILDYQPLRDYTLHFLALACSHTGATSRALDLWAELLGTYPRSLLFAQAALDRGRVQRAAGEVEEARSDFITAQDAGGPAVSRAARLELAELDLESGQTATAYAELMALRESAAGTSVGRKARQHVLDLRRSRPELRPTGRDLKTELALLMDEGAHAEAVGVAEELLAHPDSDAPDVLRQKAEALLALGKLADSLATYDRIATQYPDSRVGAAALFRAATLRWNRDLDDEAATQFLEFRRRYPSHELTPDVIYALARIEQNKGNLREARALYAQISDRYSGSRLAAEARWRLAWLDYEAGQWRAAAEAFDQLRNASTERSADALYWAARSLANAGDDDAANRYYHRILADAPASYYAYWTEQRLSLQRDGSTAVVAPPSPVELGTPPPGAADLFHFERAEALHGAGLLKLAREELRAFEESNEGAEGLSAYLARAYAAIQAYRDSIRLVAATGGDPSYLYPLAYWDRIRDLTNGTSLDPLLVLALIRQESLYDFAARSPADARGLMQLLPRTAEQVAGRAVAPEELYDPELNLELGIAHLRSLISQYEGNEMKALAAYNGGESAVAKWEQRFGNLPMDEFVENITYRETRDYVKRVLSHYRRYQQLYASPPRPVSEVRLRNDAAETTRRLERLSTPTAANDRGAPPQPPTA